MTTQNNDEFHPEIISIVAHELKTPVGAAKSFVDLMSKAGDLNDRQQQFANRALGALHRAEELIANLLDFAVLESDTPLELETCDLNDITREIVMFVAENARSRDINIHVDASMADAVVQGNKRLLEQVMSNLISNAVKYNRDGGGVFIRAEQRSTVVHVSVQDTGIGIPLKDQPRIFEWFFRSRDPETRKVSGSGLGLAITEAIIQRHGGHIRLESTPGEGSEFSFTLPVAGSEQSRYNSSVLDMPHARRNFDLSHMETASERLDAVDDDTQESFERPDTDSRNEEL